MAIIIYHPSDSALAKRIETDLAQAAGEIDAAIVVLSPQANADPNVKAALVDALEHHRRIIPVLAQAAPLPKLIEHLEPVDFSSGYDWNPLAARLGAVEGELHMKVLTPRAMAANKRAGIIVAIAAIFMFAVGLYGVGVLGIQAPPEEYAAVETEIIQTRNAYIDAALPHSTEDAASFQATVDGAAPTLRPLLVATATAIAGS